MGKAARGTKNETNTATSATPPATKAQEIPMMVGSGSDSCFAGPNRIQSIWSVGTLTA
jgi:hypothetical protein